MGSEVQKRLHKIASLVLEMRLASPAQVAKGLAACEEGRAKDLVDWLERERVLNANQRAQLEERLGRVVESPAPDEGFSTMVESAEPKISPDTRRPETVTEMGAAPPPLPAPPRPVGSTGHTPPTPPRAGSPMVTMDGHAGHRSRAPSTISPPSNPPQEEAGGELLAMETAGRYTFVRVHASGGQARVLLCRDEHVGRDVAIKEIHPEGLVPDTAHRSTSVEAQRLLREARVTGQLEHPNIVPVYDLGRRKDGALYYSMRFVRGTTLSERLKAAKTLQDRLRLLRPFMDICSAVAYAHSRGVIHRDLKPSNAMVGEFGETVLLDWGIAKVRGKRDIRAVEIANESKLMRDFAVAETVDGAAIGTPAYMSPEQAAGKVDEIDERSDVWGLGAILYQILTGKPPNAGKTQAELITAVLAGHIRPVQELCREAPPELAAICEKALRKDKNRRYKTAKDIADEVEAWLTGGKVTAYHYSGWELLRRFAEQNKKAMAVAGFILLVIIGALVAVTFALGREKTARATARRESLVANYNLAKARAEAADQQRLDFKFASAAGLAADSLKFNPAHPKSPFSDAEFAAAHPEAKTLLVRAASSVYQTRGQSLADLATSFKADEVLTQVAYSPDGARVAVGSYDGKVRVYSASARELWKTLDGHRGERVYSVAFSPDGRLLASGGRDRRIVLWDAATGEMLKALEGHESLVRNLAFSADSLVLASASWDRTVRLWAIPSGQPLRTLQHDDQVLAVALSPDGRYLASGGLDRQVRVWRLPSLELVTTVSAYASEVMSLAFSPDSRALATGSAERSIHVVNPETGRPLQVMEVSSGVGSIYSLSYSPDGRYLASAGFDATVRLWDARSGSPLATLEAHEGAAAGVAFSPKGDMLASAGYDRLLKLWRVRRVEATQLSHPAYVYAVAYSPGGRRLASGGGDKTVRVWDVTTGQAVMTLSGHGNVISRLAFSADGSLLASAARERLVVLWDMKEGRALQKTEQPGEIYDVAFSADGRLLAMACSDRTVRLFDAQTLAFKTALAGHEGPVTTVAFTPDGQRLASGAQDKTIRIWDLATGKVQQTLRGHGDWVWSLDFSSDGRRLLSSGKDGVAILWDAQTGAEQRRLEGHGVWVNRARFSPDGTLAVTGGDDQTARVWDVASGEPRLILHTTREVAGAEFSPDGRTVAVADGNTTRLYPVDFSVLDADPALLLEEARAAGYRPGK